MENYYLITDDPDLIEQERLRLSAIKAVETPTGQMSQEEMDNIYNLLQARVEEMEEMEKIDNEINNFSKIEKNKPYSEKSQKELQNLLDQALDNNNYKKANEISHYIN